MLLWLPNCPNNRDVILLGALRAGCIVTAASMHLTAEALFTRPHGHDATIAIIDMRRALEFHAAVRASRTPEPRTEHGIEPGKK